MDMRIKTIALVITITMAGIVIVILGAVILGLTAG
jgi:hypothetical protein